MRKLLLFLVSCGVLVGSSAIPGERKVPEYKLVPDWLQLPANLKLGGVSGVGVDSQDNVFLLQRIQPFVLVFDKTGKFLRSWSGIFKTPHGLRIDKDDNVWVADMANHLVQKFTPEGKLLLSLGTKDQAGEAADKFNKPADVAVGPDGEIYVADGYGNSRIAKFDKDGKFLRAWGKKGKGPGEFNLPHAVFLDAKHRVFVGDRENGRVQIFDRDGKFLEEWKDTGYPYGLFLFQDRVYLADGRKGSLRMLDLAGKILRQWEAGPNMAQAPHWVSLDRQGTLYVGYVNAKKFEKWAAQ